MLYVFIASIIGGALSLVLVILGLISIAGSAAARAHVRIEDHSPYDPRPEIRQYLETPEIATFPVVEDRGAGVYCGHVIDGDRFRLWIMTPEFVAIGASDRIRGAWDEYCTGLSKGPADDEQSKKKRGEARSPHPSRRD